MKPIYLLFVGLFLLTMSTSAYSQSDTISNFTIESNNFSIDGEYTDISSVFSKSDASISWTQTYGDSNSTSVYSVLDTTGTWDQAASSGTVTFTVQSSDGESSTLLLSGDGNTLALQLIITGSEANETLSFDINTIVYL